MDEEDSALSRNPVFQYFQDSELFDVAASNEWVVLVPSADSLGAEKIDRSYVETHIFKSSSVFQGDKYTTLDNKTIEIKGTYIYVCACFCPDLCRLD